MTLIILVRHGQTEWNLDQRFRGLADVPLDQTGLAQAEATAERVAKQWTPSAIYSSPRARTIKTAETIAQAVAQRVELPVQIHSGLEDNNFGDWQGLTPDQVRLRWPEEIDNWFDHPERARIPHGDTLEAVRCRLMSTIDELKHRHLDQNIVLVGHTATNRLILLGILGLENRMFWRLGQDNCAINLIRADSSGFTLISMNDTCHLIP